MPCDYSKYPPNWKTEIRPRILKRAGNHCEICGALNHSVIRRNKINPFEYIVESLPEQVFGNWIISGLIISGGLTAEAEKLFRPAIKVILTVAHLDHDPENWEVKDDRLKALCQRCHLQYDRETRNRK